MASPQNFHEPQDTILRDRILVMPAEMANIRFEEQMLDGYGDARALALMGKKERLKREFGYTSLIAFSTTLIASWESFAVTFQSGLINGGASSLLYGLIFSFIGTMATTASLAELSSMAPTAGGQYHWVALLAPKGYVIFFSWVAGWVSSFARLSVSASTAYVTAALVQGLIVFNNDNYEPKQWQGLLIYWLIYIIAGLVCIVGVRAFPQIETLAFIFHICSFFIIMIPLVYLFPRSTAPFVFTDFENSGGWKSNGVSWCLGLLTSAWSFVGMQLHSIHHYPKPTNSEIRIDGTSHMSEKVQNSALVVPRSMVFAMFISGTFTIAFSLALLFSIGDITADLSSPTGFPIVEVLYRGNQSKVVTTIMCSALALTLVFATFGLLASASRLTWAFARDNGLPFSKYFAHVSAFPLVVLLCLIILIKVSRRCFIPVRATLLIVIIAMLLGLINLGSIVAFNAMTTLALIGHYTSYLLPIALLLYRRFGKAPLAFGPFHLGRYGILVNLIAIFYSTVLVAIMVLPPYQPVTAANMNYAGVIFGGLLISYVVMWFGYGKKSFKGPIKERNLDIHFMDIRNRNKSVSRGYRD